ncbi:META and DUF4377 domain-containing protein [Halomonas sp. BM-2019]|uniref:META and DUF4377 domain-containing protein n=1 Tax=Halomonas sp. BM-2019 TaxID=2811227 RepID=UPI001B3C35CC|nr:MAG: META and DUF4377 domain-containing protein [Halomonas sp. BM-2019]
MPRPRALLPVLIAATLAMAACSPTADSPNDDGPEGIASHALPGTTAPTTDASATLVAYHWQLESATDAEGQRVDALFPQADGALVFRFSEGRLSVRGGCNNLNASFELDDQGHLNTTRPVSTKMACEPALMQADAAVIELLGGEPLQAQVTGGDAANLQLTAGNGTVLAFKGEPTAETRFGGPGERMFLEIAPQRVDCNHPLIPDFQCLQTREIRFDEDGLRSGEPGEWQVLYEEIEGFTHTPGHRNVLRVYRYTRETTPADASSTVFVLDMVVESEIVQP